MNLRRVDWDLVAFAVGCAVVLFGFFVIMVGRAVFDVSWFSQGAMFVFLGFGILGFGLLVLLIKGILEKL